MPKQTPAPRWRCPAVLRVKSFALAAAGTAAALVFFPLWLAVPVTVALGAWGLGLAVLGAAVTLDPDAGLLVLRMGLIRRRVRLDAITAVVVDGAKVSLGRASGGEISLYAWRKSWLDGLLGVPLAASDIGHSIARAATAAQADGRAPVPAGPRAGRTPARARSRLATALLAGAGALAIVAALVTRVHWGSPVLTVLGVIVALALGVSGLLYLLVALWILLTGRAPQVLANR